MLTRKMIVGTIMVVLVLAHVTLAERQYTYIVTVGEPPNDCNTISDAIALMKECGPDEANLGCIEVYPGTYDHNAGSADSNWLPSHCDLTGMGSARSDVTIQPPYNESPKCIIVGPNDNYISHLTVRNETGGNIGIHFKGIGKVTDCNVFTIHNAIIGDQNLVVSNCELSGMGCVFAHETFTVSDCNMELWVPSTWTEAGVGIIAEGTGTIENVRVYGSVETCWHYIGGVYGVWVRLREQEEEVSISNVEIELELTTKAHPYRKSPLRVCGIVSGKAMFAGTSDIYKGKVVVRDCTIDVNGIEGSSAAGVMVEGILINGGGTIDVWGQTEITTSRTGNDPNGYEHSLNNENGTLEVYDAPGEVVYDANKTNGTISEFLRAVNTTQDDYFTTIQAAIDDANAGDEIVVHEANYSEPYYETIDFNEMAIVLRSFDPNDWDVVAATIIDGNGSGNVVTFNSGEDGNSVLKGFTIRNGDRGIYCNGASPTIAKCVITGNDSSDSSNGGGMYNDGSSACPEVISCVFTGNSAGDEGGGMANWDGASPTVINCVFYHNTAYDRGGGMVNEESEATIVNCTFFDNYANSNGGGICNKNDSYPELTNCIFWGNYAGYDGDEIYNYNSEPSFSYCDIEEGLDGDKCGGDDSDDDGYNDDEDPEFFDDSDPDGDDDIWGTSDDGLIPTNEDDVVNEGDDDIVEEYNIETDIKGDDRETDGDPDMGAYEYMG